MINQKQIISVSFFALLLFVAYQLTVVFAPFFNAFFWAAILTFAFYPLYQILLLFTKRPNFSAAVASILIVLIVILPAVYVLQKLLIQTGELYEFVRSGGLNALIETIKQNDRLNMWYERISHYASIYVADWPSKLTGALAENAAGYVAAITKNVFISLVNFFLVIFLLFFFFRDGKNMYRFVYDLIPLDVRDKDTIFHKVNETFESVIRGQFITSAVQGLICGFTFLFLGLPAPTFFGFLTFIATLIPLFGASIVWLPFSLYLLAAGDMLKAGALFAVGLFVISTSDNILKPILIGERIKIPIFLLFFGVLGGLKAYGIMGMFLGPVFITLFFALVKIYQARYPEVPPSAEAAHPH